MKRVGIKSHQKQKILLLLLAGTALSFTRSYNQQRRIIRTVPKAWKQIDRYYLWQVIQEFHYDRLVNWQESVDGTIKITLTKEGVQTASFFDPDNIKIPKPNKWDKKWRVVIYDIPHKKRAASNALREKLREIGFKEWQKSVFVHPYHCKEQIDFITEFFEIRPFVRYAELINPTNEEELKLHFKLF